MSKEGITLNFAIDDQPTTYVKDDTPKCLAGSCEFVCLVDVPKVGYEQLFCNQAGQSVFDIYREIGECPNLNWRK